MEIKTFNCKECGDHVVRAENDEPKLTDKCEKCNRIMEVNQKYAGKKIVDVFQDVLKDLEGYKGIVINSNDDGIMEPIMSKNIVKELKDESTISKT